MLIIYLYQAYIINITQITSHNSLRKPTIKVKNIGISSRVRVHAAHLSDKDNSLTASQ